MQRQPIYMEGLERSGNVYLQVCLKNVLENPVISNRDHMITAIKNYDKPNAFIVPVRDALPSIVSSKIYRNYVFNNKLYGDTNAQSSSIENILGRYYEYNNFLLNNDIFFIAPFDKFTTDHNQFIDTLCNKYKYIKIKKRFSQEEMLEQVLKENSTYKAVHPHLGNFPRKHPPERLNIEKMILSKYHKEIDEIQEIINKLYARYNFYRGIGV
jgi:hypothetical protein